MRRGTTMLFAGAGTMWAAHQQLSYAEAWREYTFEEISKHNTRSSVYVAFAGGVYDVTEFVEGHPGGEDKIMLAAGSSLEPFWGIYKQHDQEYVRELLAEYQVGVLKEGEVAPEPVSENPAYANEPRRHPALVVRSSQPFNAETPAELLAESFVTPTELFYKRHHFAVPLIDVEAYELEVETAPGHVRRYSLEELQSKFEWVTVTSTVQCAGNRRDEMREYAPLRGGHWDGGAISNATWTGVRLADVLQDAGVPGESESVQHVHFVGLDHDDDRAYGASIPAHKAFDPKGDVLLAFRMNGEELPRDHGFPIRAVVPGTVGARNVKWVGKVVAAADESESHWQRRDYRGFPPNVSWETVGPLWESMPSIQAMPVTSGITYARLEDGVLSLKGYAWSGGGRSVIRVDLTTDDGATWSQAEIQERPKAEPNRDWAWSLWSAELEVGAEVDEAHVASRAVDDSYNVQPENAKHLWNIRGVLNNSWGRASVTKS